MSDFTKELSRLRAGNFLGGLAELGQAVKEGIQHESLVETYNKFKAEKEGLISTVEQIEGTNQRTSIVELPKGDEVDPGIRQVIDLAAHFDQIQTLQDVYGKYADVFYAIGTDESVRLGDSITRQLADRVTLEEKRADIPFQELKWRNMELQYNWSLSQYDEYVNNLEQKEEIQGIVEYMMGTDIFSKLPPDRIKYHSLSERNRIAQLENNVFRDAKDKFPDAQDGSIFAALKLAKDATGREYQYFELTPAQRQAGQAPAIAYGGYLTSMQAWTDKWLNMNEGYRNALKSYMSAGTSPEKITDETGQSVFLHDFDKIKKDAKVYNPTGDYMNGWTILASNGSPFTDLMVMEELIIDGHKVSVPKNPLYKGLMYPAVGEAFFSSFVVGNFGYNPAWVTFTIAQQLEKLKKLQEDDKLPVGDTPDDIDIRNTIDNAIFNIFAPKDVIDRDAKEKAEAEKREEEERLKRGVIQIRKGEPHLEAENIEFSGFGRSGETIIK